MSSWTELRSAAVIGTARRPGAWTQAAGQELDPAVLASAEARTLAAAALLGVQRRAGQQPSSPTDRDGPVAPAPAPPDQAEEAPAGATQLLELALAGNLGRPSDTALLLGHWLDACARSGRRAPHPSVVPLLERATTDQGLRPGVRRVIDERGAWLAAQHDAWAWAVGAGPTSASTASGRDPGDLDDLYQHTTGAARRDLLEAVRAEDAEAARRLVASTWASERAAERAALLGCLSVGLGPDDEDLLDAALDDKAKSVREVAAGLLDRLPGSARARRLGTVLAPLIEVRGMVLRRHLVVAALPDGSDAALARDLPGCTPTTVRRALVQGAPLAVWTEATGTTIDKLIKLPQEPDQLATWWGAAAIAQGDAAWIRALAVEMPAPHLLAAIPAPWPPDLSTTVLRSVRGHKGAAIALSRCADVLAERLHPDALGEVEAWRRTLTDDDRTLDLGLRRIVALVTTRRSITEAFT